MAECFRQTTRVGAVHLFRNDPFFGVDLFP